ncbi:MAG: orotate phosphoribosyltransferase [Candidatus Howiella sp.]
MQNYKLEFIEFMVRSGVLTFGDFVTKSGRKTPYFINTGNYKTGEQAANLGRFYAACIKAHCDKLPTALYGPAYKGIPLCVTTSIALFEKYGEDIRYCFNRKEVKDHGEGGAIVGYKPQNGDDILIIEDVITAGTSISESVPLLKAAADVRVTGVVVSVDRMERGKGDCSALEEVRALYGIETYAIVTVREIIEALHNRPVDGKVYIDDAVKAKMETYLDTYGAK